MKSLLQRTLHRLGGWQSEQLDARRMSAFVAVSTLFVTLLASMGGEWASMEPYGSDPTVSGGTVTASPNRAGATADFIIRFTTSASGSLVGGTDSVTLTFPAGTTVPASIDASRVRLDGDGTCNVISNQAFTDGVVPSSVSVNTAARQVSFTVPTGESVDAQGAACIGILAAAGVSNPASPGTYQIGISTSKDMGPGTSQPYAILQAAACGTTVSGPLNTDTTWTVTGSPYCVTGTVTVTPGVTLTIQPGAEIQFAATTGLVVDGTTGNLATLVARGGPSLPIRFTSDSISPIAGGWGNIIFGANSSPTVYDGTGGYQSGSVLQHALVEFAGGAGVTAAVELRQRVWVDSTTIRNNASRGIYAPDSFHQLRITNNTLQSNARSNEYGGGIRAYGDNHTITGNTFASNSATYEGGALYLRDGSTISNNTFTGNVSTSGYYGGAIRARNSNTITGNTLASNSAAHGGAIFIDHSNTITNNSFTSNSAYSYDGGAIYANQSNTITGNTFTSNSAARWGGAISAEHYGTISGNTFTSNSASQRGGAVYLHHVHHTVSRNLFVDNRVNGERRGAALYVAGNYTVSVTENTFSNNRVVLSAGESSSSGAVHAGEGAQPTLRDNTFAGNTPHDLADWNACCGTLDATNNYWSTPSDPGVANRIFDFFDDASKQQVTYSPKLTSPDPDAPRPAPIVLTTFNGDGQSGATNTALAQAFSVKAENSNGPVGNLTVTFSLATAPPGAVNHDIDPTTGAVESSFTAVTDSNGVAMATLKTGSRPGLYTVKATATDASVALFTATAFSAGCTNVGGTLTQSTTWNIGASPFCVTSSVNVSSGVTLTIDPGVEVRFADNTSLQVNGELVARGTEAERIRFTANSNSPAPGSWVQILFTDSSTPTQLNAAFEYVSGSVLQWVTIEYAGDSAASAAVHLHKPVLIDRSTIRQTSARAVFAEGDVNGIRVTNSTFANNSRSNEYGGAIRAYGDNHTITGNTFTSNTASYEGGALYVRDGSTISNNTFTGNGTTAGYSGGAIRARNSNTITGNTFTSNYGVHGGAIYVDHSNTLTNNSFTSNSAYSYDGGAIYANQSNTITGNTFTSNSAARWGGAISAEHYGTISGNTFTSNSASQRGGAVYLHHVHHTVTRNLFVDNRVAGERRGAALYVAGNYTVSVTENTFANNLVIAGGTQTSGALHIGEGAHPTVRNNSFAGNAPYDLSNWNGCCSTLDAANNYWSTASDAGILARIYDFYDDGGLERVIYRPYLSAAAPLFGADPDAPRPADIILTPVAGDGQTAAATTVLPELLTVEARGPDGEVISGAPLRFTIARFPTGAGNQDVNHPTTPAANIQNSYDATTDSSGRASASFTLGSAAGLYTVSVTSQTPTVTVGTAQMTVSTAAFTAIATTPGCINIGGPIDQSRTLTAGTPYCATSSIAVAAGVFLTVDPGVEIQFDSTRLLYLDGGLIAKGTPANPITFTSSANFGGKAPGQWRGIYFSSIASATDFDGSGAYVNGTSIFQHAVVEYAGQGSWDAIYLGTPVWVDQSAVRSNAGRGIGAPNDLARIRVTTTTFQSNSRSSEYGGAIRAYGDNHTITGNTFTSNTASYEGGAIYVRDGSTISNNTFTGNGSTAGYSGGAIRARNSNTITSNTFTSNYGVHGGAIFIDHSNTLTSNTFTSNSAYSYDGGAIYANQSNTITGNTFTSNSAARWGGAISAEHYGTITGNTFTSNSASQRGGAVYLHHVHHTVTRNLFVDNRVNGERRGAALYVAGNYTVSVTENTFANNLVIAGGTQSSGALHIGEGAHPTVRNNSFAGNAPYDLSNWNDCCGTLDATNNYWSTVQPTAADGSGADAGILARIYDFFDDGAEERVIYRPFLTTPDPDAPRPASITLTSVTGDGQTAAINSTLAQSLTVEARGATGSLVADGLPLTFTITRTPTGAGNHDIDGGTGGAQSTFTANTLNGRASATFTLGSAPGLYTVAVSGTDSSTATFTTVATTPGCTNIGGPIDQSRTLTLALSPYCATSSIAVGAGVFLTVAAGVEVRFDSTKTLYLDGGLVAKGNEAAPVRFTSSANSGAKAPGQWRGIYFSSIASATDFDSNGVYLNGTSIFQHAIVEYAGQGSWDAIYLGTPVWVDQSTVRHNAGRAILAPNDLARIRVTTTTFQSNSRSSEYGGAIRAYGDNHTITGNTFTSNTASYEGGAVYVRDGSTISNNTFTGNGSTAGYYGGAIRARHSNTITGNTFTSNSAAHGGAIFIDHSNTITNNTFTSNSAYSYDGGAIYANQSNTITGNTFTSNSAARWGGAISAEHYGTISGNTFTSNSASQRGGAVYLHHVHHTVTRNLFVDNRVDGERRGAALYVAGNYTVSVTENTFAGNRLIAGGTQTSGGIHIGEGAHPTVRNNTFADNVPYDLSTVNTGSGSVTATDNYWSTIVESQIQQRIYDRSDGNTTLEIVNYTPWLSAPDPDAPSTVVARVRIISGNDQIGPPGSLLPQALTVEARGATNQPRTGLTVTFTITGSPSTSTGTDIDSVNADAQTEYTITTGSDGRAEARLRLGDLQGAYTVRVRADVSGNGAIEPANEEVVFTATAGPAAVRTESTSGAALTSVHAGDQLVITGGGLASGTSGTIRVYGTGAGCDSTGVILANFTESNGSFNTGLVTIPLACANQTVTIKAIASDGTTVIAETTLIVTAAAGSITVVLQAAPQAPDDFTFELLAPSGVQHFALDNDPASALLGTRSFNGLDAGSFTVRQTVLQGWGLIDIACSSTGGSTFAINGSVNNNSFNPGDDRAVITLAAGDSVTCTFGNSRLGSITVIQDSVPDNAQSFTYTLLRPSNDGDIFFLDDDPTNNSRPHQTTKANLLAGSYEVTQTPAGGWSAPTVTCPSATTSPVTGGVRVELGAGQHVTCTFTNNGQAQAYLRLTPAGPVTTAAGGMFSMTIELDTGTNPVDGAQAVLSFDPTYLEAVNSNGTLATQAVLGNCDLNNGISPSTSILNTIDNTLGRVRIARGAAQGGSESGVCSLASVTFRAKGPATNAAPTPIGFILPPTESTRVAYAGSDLVLGTGGVAVTIGPRALSIVDPQPRRAAHGFPFGRDLVVQVTPAPQNDTTTTVALQIASGPPGATLSCIVDGNVQGTSSHIPNDGRAVFHNCVLDLVGEYVLQASVAGAPSIQTLPIQVGWTGNASNETPCLVDILDFSVLLVSFNKRAEDAGFRAEADFNGDDVVDIEDFSKLVALFNTRCAQLTATPGSYTNGANVLVEGSHFAPLEAVTLTVVNTATGTVTTPAAPAPGADGSFAVELTVPGGPYRVRATQRTERIIAGAAFTITADNTAPGPISVSSTAENGTYAAGATIPITVTFNEPVAVTGTPLLTIETGIADAQASYFSGSGTSVLTFTYTVAAGHNSGDLEVQSTSALTLNGGTIRDAAGNHADLALPPLGSASSLSGSKAIMVDTGAATVTGVSSTKANGTYGAGTSIAVTVSFSEAVAVVGTPQLTLETGTSDAVVDYTSGSGTPTLTFTYIVAAGHSSADLQYASTTALALNGSTIRDAANPGNDAVLTLPALDSANSLAGSKAIVIDTGLPTVTGVSSTTANGSYKAASSISIQVSFSEPVTVTGTPSLALNAGSGSAATYSSGSTTSTLNFTYTVAAGHNSPDLDYSSTTALTGTIKDSANNSAVLTLPAPGQPGSLSANESLVIDTTVPTVTGVTSVTADGTYGTGSVIDVRVTFSEAVNVSGTPQLTLATGSPATTAINYSGGSGTSTLEFTYTVVAGNSSADLDYSSTAALMVPGGATIRDFAGNDATRTLAAPGLSGSLGAGKDLVINTTAPVVQNVTSSKGNGTYGTGTVIEVAVTFSAAVNVTGTPQIALATGSPSTTAVNYTGGTGTSTTTFTYTVAAGNHSEDLDYASSSALTLPGGATIRDLGGNDAVLALPGPGQSGSLGANKALVIDTSGGTTVNVGVEASSFSNGTITIAVGDTVRWTWNSSGHSVTSGTGEGGSAAGTDNLFCSPNNSNCSTPVFSNTGFTYSHTFTQVGEFPYFCAFHHGMTGKITVTAP